MAAAKRTPNCVYGTFAYLSIPYSHNFRLTLFCFKGQVVGLIRIKFLLLTHRSWVDLSLDEQPKNGTSLRHVQLEVRNAELELSITFLKVNKYRRPAYLEGAGFGRLGPARTLQVIAGYPFGGSLALRC